MQAINSEAYGRSTRPPSRLERATPGRSGHERGGLDMYQPSSRPPSRAQASQEDNIPYPNFRHRVGESRLRRPTVDEEERKHKCLRCGDSFRRKQHLEDHEERHLNRKQYQCDVVGCLECFNTKGDVRSHIKNKHGIHS
ncbi:hypothetical protein BD626DRAFT_519585 [Schizophyllum amplum]|uniref:C2H2-type domain-containing protein n=1 Tax=Schizophyllum amplum TaxID=97359 RepID=A0A550BV79_9AGAR|nr:hypothetical protein BD626DRAFT_519585 [Auriculariopsis ampla]